MTPAQTTDRTTQASVVRNDSTLFANTEQAVDTVVRPTAAGFDSIQQIRNSSAPTTFSWNVTLPSDRALKQLDDKTIAIVRVSQPLPSDSAAGPQDLNPGTMPPVPPNDPAVMTEEDGTLPAPTPIPAPTESWSATPDAETQKSDADQRLTAAQTHTSHDVLALISAPAARDRDGDSVPTSISANDRTVTTEVEHRQANTSYPVAAQNSTSQLFELTVLFVNLKGFSRYNEGADPKVPPPLDAPKVAKAIQRRHPQIVGINEIVAREIAARPATYWLRRLR